ncbi:hypothetical protein ACLOJK_000468 [Asimina triloba]
MAALLAIAPDFATCPRRSSHSVSPLPPSRRLSAGAAKPFPEKERKQYAREEKGGKFFVFLISMISASADYSRGKTGARISVGEHNVVLKLSDIIWGDNEADDHIVPYPKGNGENPLFTIGEYNKKQANQENSNAVKSLQQKTSGTKNDFVGNKLEANHRFNTNEELSAPSPDIDPWPDFLMSSTGQHKQSADANGRDSMDTEVSGDFPVVTDLDSVTGEITMSFHMSSDKQKQLRRLLNSLTLNDGNDCNAGRLSHDPPLFGNDYEDKDDGRFIDYGWANIGNFDDLDRIFRNDSMLGHEMIGNTDELWSSSTNAITSPVQSVLLGANSPSSDKNHEVKSEFELYQNHPLGQDSDTKNDAKALPNKDEAARRKSKPSMEEKTEDSTETTAETMAFQSRLASESSGVRDHFTDKTNRQKKMLKCRKKVEEKSKAKSMQNISGAWPPTANQIQQLGNPKMHASTGSTLQTFPSSVLSPQRQLQGPESLRYVHNSGPYMHTAYGYPAHHFPVMPILPQSCPEREQNQMFLGDYKVSKDSPKLRTQQQKLPDVQSIPSTMTPQEKIEKLRRRQQMQALLAIQQQQQQFGKQISSTDHPGQKCSQENKVQDSVLGDAQVEEKSVEMIFPSEQDDSTKISMLTDELTLEETILDQLQDAIGKLDVKARLCIRDSLFRLARSAMQRNSVSDTSSTNKGSREEIELANEETNSRDRYEFELDSPDINDVMTMKNTQGLLRSTQLPDGETDTNRIDRTVAHLLFHRPSESGARPVKDGFPESPDSCNPESFPAQPKTEEWANLPAGCLPENLADKQHDTHVPQTPTARMPVDRQQENPHAQMLAPGSPDVNIHILLYRFTVNELVFILAVSKVDLVGLCGAYQNVIDVVTIFLVK